MAGTKREPLTVARSGQGVEGAGPPGGYCRQGKGSRGAKCCRGAGKGRLEPGQCQDQRGVTLLCPCLPSAASYAVFSPAQRLPAACHSPWQGQDQGTPEFGWDLLAVILTPPLCQHQLWVPGSHRGPGKWLCKIRTHTDYRINMCRVSNTVTSLLCNPKYTPTCEEVIVIKGCL